MDIHKALKKGATAAHIDTPALTFNKLVWVLIAAGLQQLYKACRGLQNFPETQGKHFSG